MDGEISTNLTKDKFKMHLQNARDYEDANLGIYKISYFQSSYPKFKFNNLSLYRELHK